MSPSRDSECGGTWLPGLSQLTRSKCSVVAVTTLCGLLYVCAISALIKGGETKTIGHLTHNGDTVWRLDSCEFTKSVQYSTAQGEISGARPVLAALNATSCARPVLAAPKATQSCCARSFQTAPSTATGIVTEDDTKDLGDYSRFGTTDDGDSNTNPVVYPSLSINELPGAGCWPGPKLEFNSSDAIPASDALFASHRPSL